MLAVSYAHVLGPRNSHIPTDRKEHPKMASILIAANANRRAYSPQVTHKVALFLYFGSSGAAGSPWTCRLEPGTSGARFQV